MLKHIEQILINSGIEKADAKAEAKLLVCEVSGLSIEEILSGKKIENEAEIVTLAQKRADTKAPIQHILGFAYFMGDKFFVDENVLIPRPETELLVQSAVEIAQRNFKNYKETLSILDIGTGTGCIPCEISKTLGDKGFNNIEIMGIDISLDALRIAIKNMETLGQQRRVIFRKSDIYSGLRPIDKFNIIVSNPPYIPFSAKNTLMDEVKNFDPDLALFASDEMGVEFYEKIIKDAKNHLKTDDRAFLIFELGFTNGISQAPIVFEIAQKYDFKIEFIRRDLSNIERVICLSV